MPIKRDKFGRSYQIPIEQVIASVMESEPPLDLPNTTPKQMLERLGRVLYPLPSEDDFRQCALSIPMLRMCDTREGRNVIVDVGNFMFNEEDKITYEVLAGDPQFAPGMKIQKAIYAYCVGTTIRSVFPESQDAFGFGDF